MASHHGSQELIESENGSKANKVKSMNTSEFEEQVVSSESDPDKDAEPQQAESGSNEIIVDDVELVTVEACETEVALVTQEKIDNQETFTIAEAVGENISILESEVIETTPQPTPGLSNAVPTPHSSMMIVQQSDNDDSLSISVLTVEQTNASQLQNRIDSKADNKGHVIKGDSSFPRNELEQKSQEVSP